MLNQRLFHPRGRLSPVPPIRKKAEPTTRHSSAYRDAIVVALVLQILTAAVLRLLLDGGTLAKAGGAAMVGFWIGVAIVMMRWPRDPIPRDLLYVRWGYVPMLLIALALS